MNGIEVTEAEIYDEDIVKPCLDVKPYVDECIPIEYVKFNETLQKSPAKRRAVIVSQSEWESKYGFIISTDVTIDEPVKIECESDTSLTLQTTKTTCDICRCVILKPSRNHQANGMCNECALNYSPNVVLQRNQFQIEILQQQFECNICGTTVNGPPRKHNMCNECSPKYLPKIVLQNIQKIHHKSTGYRNKLTSLDEHRQEQLDGAQYIKQHQCRQCVYATDYLSNMIRHMKSHSGIKSVTKFKCETCDKQFTDKRTVKEHKLIHLDEWEKQKLKSKFKCKICEYSTMSDARLKQHMKIHEDPTFECNVCAKKFIRNGTLKMHIQSHLSHLSFQCTMCPKKYKLQSSLKFHIERSHVDKALRRVKYQCFICKYSNSVSLSHLRIHMLSHSDVRSFQCSLCSRRFKTNSTLTSHKNVVHFEQRQWHECQICFKKLSSRSSLRVHLETHLDETLRIRKYKCGTCVKAFYKEKDLIIHQSTVHVDQQRIFKCNKCSKEFSKSFGFKYHLRMHINYPFDCRFCTRHFSNEQKRELHETAKHKISKFGRRTFECYVCKNAIKNRGKLQLHLRKHTGEKPFRCQVCCKAFMLKSVLVKHKQTHLDEKEKEKLKKFKCHLCAFASSRNRDLQAHLVRHAIKFPCTICSKILPTEGRLAYHHRSHTGLFRRKYECYICKKSVGDLHQLRKHLIKHSDEKLFHCELCEKHFKYKITLQRHQQTHLDESEKEKLKKFKCHICVYATHSNPNLKRHMLTHGGGDKRFLCTKCPMKFPTKCQLNSHKQRHLDDKHRIKNFKCHVCDIAFAVKANLKRHMMTHTKEKPFPCDKCSRKYLDKNSLKKHLLAHIETPYFCTKCYRKFAQKSDLNKHMPSHKKKLYLCKLCPSKYTMNYYLKQHIMRIHTKAEKPFKCTECSAKFYDKCDLKRHLRIHEGPKYRSYECYLCHFDSNVIYQLKKHMLQH